MAKRRDDELLGKLHPRANPTAADVCKGLAHLNWIIVDAAAKAACGLPAGDVAEALVAALHRLFGPVEDPGADAILAVLDAMRKHQITERQAYRDALFYERIQRTFGDGIDVGATVRASACMAIVESGDPAATALLGSVLFEQTTQFMVQDNPAARVAAARGLGAAGDESATAPLRLKLSGRQRADTPEVLGECIASLVQLAGGVAVDWVADALQRHGGAAAGAAVVPVGELRTSAALEVMRLLRDALRAEAAEHEAMIGFALLRDPDATDELFDALVNRPAPVQEAAAKALRLLRHDAEIVRRFDKAVRDLPNARTLAACFRDG